ncbi:MAG TPA: hypothetical protein VIS99_12800 [Terrimicrobiaceae bacterium]
MKVRKKVVHANSSVTMKASIFQATEDIARILGVSRNKFILENTETIVEMCENREARYLPDDVLLFDLKKGDRVVRFPSAANDQQDKARGSGIRFNPRLEKRIARIVNAISWTRNRFVEEAMIALVAMCEHKSKRTLPLAVALYDAAMAHAIVPVRLKPRPVPRV